MDHLGIAYYAGLLSAAQFHGAAHQRPQLFHVVAAKNRPPIQCGKVRVQFVARWNVAEVPTCRVNTPRGYVSVSTPEATAFDLVGYSEHCAGLENAATVLGDLAERLDGRKLAALAPISPIPWAQRLGFLLEKAGGNALTGPLADYGSKVAKEYVALNTTRPVKHAPRDRKWKLLVNDSVEPDL